MIGTILLKGGSTLILDKASVTQPLFSSSPTCHQLSQLLLVTSIAHLVYFHCNSQLNFSQSPGVLDVLNEKIHSLNSAIAFSPT